MTFFWKFDAFLDIRTMPLFPIGDYDPKEILKLSKSDKKMDGGRIRFILLKKVGKAVIDTAVTDEEILNAIDQLIIKDY